MINVFCSCAGGHACLGRARCLAPTAREAGPYAGGAGDGSIARVYSVADARISDCVAERDGEFNDGLLFVIIYIYR